ncbi:metal-dependent hydrolase [Cuniculiplasma sp. SKW3]|uniref:metal-dependent hydrolase n=1 Tax=Cuniculiplasma sp. SKW3 TaxID=3400170 RepID=UPI003FD016F4
MVKNVEMIWQGHACFEIKKGKNVVIDPFIEGNTSAKIKKEDIKADVVVVTHGHSDHVGDALFIAKNSKAPIVTMVELAWLLSEKDNSLTVHDINFSGSVQIDGIKISAVPALHSSSYEGKYAGNPGGMVINFGDLTVYHAGDTGLFKDMELIGSYYKPDVALLPIGGHYTMSAYEAAEAVKMIKPKVAIPMHYNTFPLISQDPNIFKNLVEKETKTRVIVPKISEKFQLDIN